MFPSFMTEVHAISDHKKDNIKCNNFNLNGNGLNINAIPESLRGILSAQTQTEDSDIGSIIFDNNEKRHGSDRDFSFVCLNNNNNRVIGEEEPVPIPPTPRVNNVCSVWTDDNSNILFARSTDGGLTFSEPENISEDTGNSLGSQISSEGNNVYVVWTDTDFTSGNSNILFARSTDGGLTFSEPENITENIGNSANQPQISSEGNNVYVVWSDFNSHGLAIFFARSTDGGLTFSEPENISENIEGASLGPQISSEGNNLYVVWTSIIDGEDDRYIFFARSTDGGLTFSEPENLSENLGRSSQPQISSEGNNVYVVWQDRSGNDDIFFSRSTDGGLTFSELENISEILGQSSEPQISSEGNNVYVIWQDSTPGNDDIFFSRSTDGGLTFSEPENISEDTGFSSGPQISSSSIS